MSMDARLPSSGRSMDNSTEIAQDLGYLDVPQGLIINPGADQRNAGLTRFCV